MTPTFSFSHLNVVLVFLICQPSPHSPPHINLQASPETHAGRSGIKADGESRERDKDKSKDNRRCSIYSPTTVNVTADDSIVVFVKSFCKNYFSRSQQSMPKFVLWRVALMLIYWFKTKRWREGAPEYWESFSFSWSTISSPWEKLLFTPHTFT